MSRRPIQKKQVARLRKALRAGLPAHINLVEWLKDRRYAQTTGEAKALILDRRVKSESHTLGIKTGYDKKGRKVEYVDPIVPANLRATLRVSDEVA